MNKEMNVSDNDHHDTFELVQSSSIDADTAKMTWHSPKLRVLQVSQETKGGVGGPASSGAAG